jgi:hypothetical protein
MFQTFLIQLFHPCKLKIMYRSVFNSTVNQSTYFIIAILMDLQSRSLSRCCTSYCFQCPVNVHCKLKHPLPLFFLLLAERVNLIGYLLVVLSRFKIHLLNSFSVTYGDQHLLNHSGDNPTVLPLLVHLIVSHGFIFCYRNKRHLVCSRSLNPYRIATTSKN